MTTTVATVIGAHGHLGQELVRQLAAAGCAVLPDDLAAVDGVDVVVHIDERVRRPAGSDPLAPVDSSTVDVLLHACAAGRVGRVVHVSSGDVVLPGRRPTGDELVRRAAEDGLDVVAVHPTGIIGPGDPGTGHLTRLLLDVWEHRRTAAVGGGLDWVDVRDVAAGTVAAATTATPGTDYLLAGHWATIEDVVDQAGRLVAEVAGGPPQHAPAAEPPWAAELLEPIEVAAAQRDLGFTSRPLEDTLRDTIDWFATLDRSPASADDASLVPA